MKPLAFTQRGGAVGITHFLLASDADIGFESEEDYMQNRHSGDLYIRDYLVC